MSPRQDVSNVLPSRAKRRPHTKSRTGCTMCKQRRVKCDEARPVCKNCTIWKSSCCYASQDALSQSSSTGSVGETKRAPGRPRKHYDSYQNPKSLEDVRNTVIKSSTSESTSLEQDLSLDLADLELLHHYYTFTSSSLSSDDPIQSIYRVNVPRMGLSYPFVLRLLLALAGQHIHHLGPKNKRYTELDHYAILAEKHFFSAVPQVKLLLLSELTKDNCQVAYQSSVLICIYLLARGPRPGDYLVFGEHASPMWISLLHGVRSIRLAVDDDHQSGWLAYIGERTMPSPTADVPSVCTFDIPRLNWQIPLQELTHFIVTNIESELREHYSVALDELAQHFSANYGSDEDGSYHGDTIHQLNFRWLYVLHDEMMHKMQQKEPLAIIMVAYYALLLRVTELSGCWFVKGWAHHILMGSYEILEDRYRLWLKWPFESVGLKWPTVE